MANRPETIDMTDAPIDSRKVEVATVDQVKEDGPISVQANGHSLALFYAEGTVHATALRCPHMGFPLTDGTVEDGLLTCPWHHARFELSCGDTLDPFADDVETFPTTIEEGVVFVDVTPDDTENPADHWRGRLAHGLRENIGLVIAKSVIGLDEAGVPSTVPLEEGVTFGARYRADGWGRGLTTLIVMANLAEGRSQPERRRALYLGLQEVASTTAGEPPFFVQESLSISAVSADRLHEWFCDCIDVRDADGGERVLRAAIQQDLPPTDIASMLLAGATEHIYLDSGHRLDFLNKAFEALDVIGWEQADTILPTLVRGLADANRAEERSSWRQPIDLAELRFDATERLKAHEGDPETGTWEPTENFIEVLLGEDPELIVDRIVDATERGASATTLAAGVAAAAAHRVAQFGTSNEFNDWNTVHHTYSYANAVYWLTTRTNGRAPYLAVLDGALAIYRDRFLNVPPAPLPEPTESDDPQTILKDLKETFDVEGDEQVGRAGSLVAEYLETNADPARLCETLTAVLVREDVGFHTRQNLEAGIAQYRADAWIDDPVVHLIATARYLAAHTPTRRSAEQTYRIADRLHRGEKIHEAEEGGGNDH